MKKGKLYCVLILVFLLVFGTMNLVSGYFSKRVEVYISNKATVVCSELLEVAIREEVVNRIDVDEIVLFNKAPDETVKSIYINTKQVNQILSGVNASITSQIKRIEREELTLPLGIVLSETLLYNLGPDIKIHMIPVGSAITDITSTVKPYGINSSLIEVGIRVQMKVETVVPLKKGLCELDFSIPLVIQIINSDVPRYYYNTSDVIPFLPLD